MTNLDSILKSRDIANKGPSSQGYGFSSGHVWMWELDCEESWVPKTWCFWTVVLEKTLESSLDCKEIQPVHPKGDQSWVFIGRTDPEAETPVLWPPDAKSWLIWKDPNAGRDWGQEEEGTTEDEMAGWHHWIYGHEFGVNYGSWWWTGRPGMLWFMGSQRVGHDWVTELNWTDFFWTFRWFRIVFLTLELCGNLFYFLKLSGSVPFSHFYLDSSPPISFIPVLLYFHFLSFFSFFSMWSLGWSVWRNSGAQATVKWNYLLPYQ